MIKKKSVFIFIIFFMFSSFLLQNSSMAKEKQIFFTCSEFKPLLSPDLPEKGFHTEIVREAFKRVGYNIEIQFMPFARALKEAGEGKYDGIISVFYSKNRENRFFYSAQIIFIIHSFYEKKGANIAYNNFEDLKGLRIGKTRGAFYGKEFMKAESTLFDVQEVTNTSINLKKLLAERIDLVITSKIGIHYEFPELAGQIQPLPKPLKKSPTYLVIGKKRYNALGKIEAFNQGLKIITDDGTLDKILKKHNIPKNAVY